MPRSCAASSASAICRRDRRAPPRPAAARARCAPPGPRRRRAPSPARARRRPPRGRRSRRCSDGAAAPAAAPRARSGRGARESAVNAAGSTLIATSRLQPRVGGAPDLAHAALAELGGDLVGAEAGAGASRPSSPSERRRANRDRSGGGAPLNGVAGGRIVAQMVPVARRAAVSPRPRVAADRAWALGARAVAMELRGPCRSGRRRGGCGSAAAVDRHGTVVSSFEVALRFDARRFGCPHAR